MQRQWVNLLYALRGQLPRRVHSAVIGRVNPTRGRYLVPKLSFDGLIERLNQRDIEYVLLGGAPDRPEILVSDADLDRVRDLVTLWPIGIPVSVYTPSARPGTSYTSPLAERHPRNRMAVFPRRIAEGMLRRAVADPAGPREMTARDALFACAYRAAYMEATCCDWSDSAHKCSRSRGFETELKRLAVAADVSLPEPLTPRSLDAFLAHEGWRPPLDLLEKAAEWAPWIRQAFPALEHAEPVEAPGVAVFFIRERALQNGLKSEILETLKEKGFDLLHVADLDEAQSELAGHAFRGGNWGMGSWKVDGGRPGCIVVGLDLLPLPVSGKLAALHPTCDDLKIIRAKVAARLVVNASCRPGEEYNGLHSTDNSDQAWRVVHDLFPESEELLRKLVDDCRRQFTATTGAVRDLTRYGSRAKVALVRHDGALAIRKTFRPSALRYMEREADVMETLAPICPEIPRLLARGDDYNVVEYVGESDPLPQWPYPLPLGTVRQLARFIKTCVANGYDPIDMKPSGNVLLTRHGITVIDYEFWRRCDPATPPEECYCLAGLPKDYTGDRPRGVLFLYDPYPAQWFRFTALSVKSFLYDPAWLQHLKRGAHLSRRYASWLVRALGRRILGGSSKPAGGALAPA
jgi:hypothetical protein